MSRPISAEEERARLLADILRRVPDKLARVQAALKPVAQGKPSTTSHNERLVVAQACTELQFAIADVISVVTFVTGALEASTPTEKSMLNLINAHQSVVAKKGSDLH